jgi:hypothetical protein
MGFLVNRSVRSVLALSALAMAAACSDASGGISGVEPGGATAAKAGGGSPGDATGSTYSCSGVAGFYGYQIAPYCTGGPFGGFQSTSGTGAQGTVTITFANPVNYVSFTALDPDYSGNTFTVKNASGVVVSSGSFIGDNAPGQYTESGVGVTSYGSIKEVILTAAPNDYVAYRLETFN